MALHAAPTAGLAAETAESSAVREAMQWFTREKQWITEMQQQVCRVPAPTFLEQQRAEWMARELAVLGCATRLDRAGNLIALPQAASNRPLIAVTAHMDTVLAPRHRDDISIDSEGRLRGPGVSDNGAGLAALLAMAGAIQASGPPPSDAAELVFVANVGEEGDGNLAGMRYLCRQSPLASRIAAYLVLDGASTEHITVRALGSRRFDLTFSGPGGHSWNDYGIGNPIHALSRAISLFSDTQVDSSPRSSINVGVVDGGASVNSIPAQARAKIDIRSESNNNIEYLVARLQQSVEQAQETENRRSSGSKVTALLQETGSRPAASLPERSELLAFLRGVDAHLGIRSRLECSSTDANVPLSMNRPALSIGAGGQGGGAHTPQEWFSPEGRDLGLKRILLAVALLMRFGAEN